MKFTYFFIKNFLNKKEIKKINSLINKVGKPFNKQAPTVKTSICHTIPYKEIHKIKDFKSIISWSNREAFALDLYENIFDTYDACVRNIYSSKLKGEYKWHFDAEPHQSNYTIKLTTLINLSEKPYEGGDFFIFDGKKDLIKEFKEPGSVLIFPSFYLHQVSPVTKGERITATIFVTGPKWK